jgi:hypothetical protein
MRLPPCVSAISSSVCGALFKRLCSGRVFLRMAGARLLPREVQPSNNPRHRRRMIADAPAPQHQRCQIVERVGRDAVGLGIGAVEDRLRQLGLASRVELARAPGLGTIVEPGQAVLVVALDRIAQRLVGHPLQPCRLLAIIAVERIGNGPHPHRRPALLLVARAATKLGRRPRGADLDAVHRHGCLPNQFPVCTP